MQGDVPHAGGCLSCRGMSLMQGDVPHAGGCPSCRGMSLMQGDVPHAGGCPSCRLPLLKYMYRCENSNPPTFG